MSASVPSRPRPSDLLPGGAVTRMGLPGGGVKVIARGSASRIWDADGDKACLSLAHTDEELDRAVEAFAESLGELEA